MSAKEVIKKFIPKFLLRFYHFCLAFLGAVLFGFPGMDKSLKIIGVTGTSGKSTTVDFITRILEESGSKVASASSIRFKVGEKEWENKYKMTMPGRFVVRKFLRQAKTAGCKYVVLEVTSEGIRQFRHKFINFDAVVFTNLTPEHIESHGGFENYRNEKLKLFHATKNIHVINTDDENSKYFWNIPAKQKIGFSAKDAEKVGLRLNLLGDFNVLNALAAITVAKAYGIDLETCKRALEKAKVISGRMEVVAKEPFGVVVDYAHTPAQLEAVYKTFQGKNLICVLGSCGGGRDKWKRPILGQIAEKYCKKIIITNEDPYDENPLSIIKEIESALSADGANSRHQIILDRREAIKKAIKLAKPGDVVVITGKGSEPWMCIENGKKIPWDDRKIAREAVESLTR
ncbi:MAG: UDP-N-acetylmuramoyl-L-alanyl-D-glutamate--2,6-diaminopimelate ligase [Candidatus Staskawiczbacteria bacterium]|nr:UDP-N-acetylmuramoyl-L-alanyl-D-glutamate--2,6-diaminopimelate ligase [Candidatus Staskawiczbacteria bacterium]